MGLYIGSVATILCLLLRVVTGNNEGMAVWAVREETPLRYSLWDGNRLNSSHEIGDSSRAYRKRIRGDYSLIRDEAIVVSVAVGHKGAAQIYSGGQWSDILQSPLYEPIVGKVFGMAKFCDVRYESQSGNPLIVWHEGSSPGTLSYASWTGSRWSLGNIFTTVRLSLNWVQLFASPKSNEMVLVVSGAKNNGYAVVWDGGSWGDGLVLENDDDVTVTVTATFEQQSGRAIVLHAGGSQFLTYRIWNGATWSGVGSVSPPAGLPGESALIKVAADPSTNRIVAVIRTLPRRAVCVTVWDGNNSWGSKAILLSSSTSGLGINIAVAFESTSQRALVVYVQDISTGGKYRTWSSDSSWSDEGRTPNFGVQNWGLNLFADLSSNEVMLTVRDDIFCRWNGAGWGGANRVTNTTGHVKVMTQPWFTWMPPVPSAMPSSTPSDTPSRNPSSKPSQMSSTSLSAKPSEAPSEKPSTSVPRTTSPTLWPTFQRKTASPTLLPSPSPTALPTGHPTPRPKLTPTLLPTTSPTIVPTMRHADSVTLVTSKPTTKPRPSDAGLNAPAPDAPSRKKTGMVCSGKNDCISNTCRSGVCMASSECYPVKHKYGTPFDTNAINVVFVGSAFNTSTHDAWRERVEQMYHFLAKYKMFGKDIDHLNFFRVDPPEMNGSFCRYGCHGLDRLMCCDEDTAENLASMCFSVGANLQTVVIHASNKYGGAGYRHRNIGTVSTDPRSGFILVHELGHSLFELNDEYASGDGSGDDPNCATSSTCEKWSDLIDNTPAGYNTVKCIPGCQGGNYFVSGLSYMNVLGAPVGAVHDLFACCTYLALTKSLPTHCKVFEKEDSPNYLYNYCKYNDFQGYGAANYENDTKLQIMASSMPVSKADDTKFVYVADPVRIKVTLRRNGKAVVKETPLPLPPGMYYKEQVQGDFRRLKDAAKQNVDSVVKVKIFYESGRETYYLSQNSTIDVPMLPPEEGQAVDDGAPRRVFKTRKTVALILGQRERRTIRRVRASIVLTKKQSKAG